MDKNCFKYKEMLKKKGGLGSDETSTSGKQKNQAGVAKKVVEEPCDALSVDLGRGKGRFLDACYLTRGAHTTCAQGRSGLAHTSLLKEAQS